MSGQQEKFNGMQKEEKEGKGDEGERGRGKGGEEENSVEWKSLMKTSPPLVSLFQGKTSKKELLPQGVFRNRKMRKQKKKKFFKTQKALSSVRRGASAPRGS